MMMLKMDQLNDNCGATGLLPMPSHPPPILGQQEHHHANNIIGNHPPPPLPLVGHLTPSPPQQTLLAHPQQQQQHHQHLHQPLQHHHHHHQEQQQQQQHHHHHPQEQHQTQLLHPQQQQQQQLQHSGYASPDSRSAAGGLNGVDFRGRSLQAESLDRQRQRTTRNPRAAYVAVPGSGRPADFPLRLLVQSDMVGAIIGRQGTTIRQITQQTRARVDVHRKDNVGSLEKAITIYGNPDNCTNACRRILEVMQQEANTTNKGDVILKMLAHNNLIGRIIGKSGNTIKRIMQDTETRITVSSINDINSFNLERIITVKGEIVNMSRAENLVSAKLRQSYENDLQAMAPQSIMFPGLHPMAMMSTGNNAPMGGGGGGAGGSGGGGGAVGGGVYPNRSAVFPGANYPMYQPPAGLPPGASEQLETTYLYIANTAVGAIIGTKGSHIRNIIRFSSASVKIAPIDAERPLDAPQMERKVTIVGSPEAQWKAQYLIFEKLREEGFTTGTDDVRLTVEILVASSQVGRIIGKGGQNVRELQRVTGSIIKLPEHGLVPPADEETTVHIIGHFFSVQSAQRRIRAMMLSTNPPPVPKRSAQRAVTSPQQQAPQPAVAAGAAATGAVAAPAAAAVPIVAPQPQASGSQSGASTSTAAAGAAATAAGPQPSTSSQ